MGKAVIFWATFVLTLLLGGYAAKLYLPAKHSRQFAVQAATKVTAAQAVSKAISAATPEDPGEVSVVGPLAVWLREADPKQDQESIAESEPQPMDHVVLAPPMPEKYLRAQFQLKKSAQFRFVIPPHILGPKLHGSFQSFVKRGVSTAVRPANINLALMNAQQFDDFIHKRASEASFELQSSQQDVDFALPGVHDQPQEYHLVFTDPAARPNLFVRADFVVEAE